ncbi:sialidase family protein [uncultured Nitrosomonas sp.]|uniref:sialidase family protein n=1 Tax=uncultured Nitrosomonas sp. TaxID=156424 RepID=UPI00262213D4|nr:sialidase family protein [uncultured Nitrosomonas sp.]
MTPLQWNAHSGIHKASLTLPRFAALIALAATLAVMAGYSADNTPAQPLTHLRRIASPALPGSSVPNLFAADGRIFMSWVEPATPTPDPGQKARYAVKLATLDLNAHGTIATSTEPRWSEPRTIVVSDKLQVNWATFPSVIQLPDGTLAAHWLIDNGLVPGGYDISVHTALSADDGHTWSADVIPHQDSTKADHAFVSLFPHPENQLGIVWLDGREFARPGGNSKDDRHSHGMHLRFTTTNAAGGLGEDQLLNGTTCTCCQTDVAMTSDGPIIVYRHRTENEVRDIHIIRYVDHAWTQSRPVHNDGWTIAACPVNGPAITAMNRQVAVAWFTAAGGIPLIQVAFSTDAGATFSPPVRVDDGLPAGRVDIELLPDGSALVSWLERMLDGSAQIRVRRVEPHSNPGKQPIAGSAMTITSSSTMRTSGFPQMVRASDHVVFAWTVPGKPSEIHSAVAEISRK